MKFLKEIRSGQTWWGVYINHWLVECEKCKNTFDVMLVENMETKEKELNYKYCPYCRDELIKKDEVEELKKRVKELEKENQKYKEMLKQFGVHYD